MTSATPSHSRSVRPQAATCAKYIGRVGGLAVALGVGAAVAGFSGTAWADGTTEGPGSTDTGQDSQPQSTADDSAAAVETKPNPGKKPTPRLPRIVVRINGDDVPSIRKPNTATTAPAPRYQPNTSAQQVVPKPSNTASSEQPSESSSPGQPSDPKPHQRSTQTSNGGTPSATTPAQRRQPLEQVIRDNTSRVEQSAVNAPVSSTGTMSIGAVAPKPSESQAVSFSGMPLTDARVSTVQPAVASTAKPPTNPVTAVVTGLLAAVGLDPTATNGPVRTLPPQALLGALQLIRRELEHTFLNKTPEIGDQSVSVTEGEPQTITLPGKDAEGDTLTYTVTDGPDHGQLSAVEYDDETDSYTVTYTAAGDYEGPDAFVVTASDASSGFHLHGFDSLFRPAAAHKDTSTVSIDVHADASTPVIVPNDDGTYDMAVKFGSPGEFDDVVIPETGPDAPKYWRVTGHQYDPETGTLTVTMEPTLAAQLRAGAGMDVTDSFAVQGTSQTAAQSRMATFALRAAPETMTALADQGSTVSIPAPPGSVLTVQEDAVGVDGYPAGVVVTDKYAYVMTQPSGNNPSKVTVIGADPTDAATYNKVVTTIDDVGYATVFGTQAGDNLYVPNLGTGTGGSVTVIDTNTNQITGSIDTGPGSFPASMVATPDGKRLYVTDLASGDVYVIDNDPANSATYHTVVDTISTLPPPVYTDQSSDSYSLAPAGISTNADGSRLYLSRWHYVSTTAEDENGDPVTTSKTTGEIVVIDTTSNSVVDLDPSTDHVDAINTGDMVPNVLTSNGNRLYAMTYDYDALVAVMLSQSQETPPTNIAVIDIDPNLARPEIIDANPSTAEIDGLTHGDLPYNAAVSPDGSVAYVVNVLDGTVTVIDTVTNEQIGDAFIYDSNPQTAGHGSLYADIVASSPNGKQMYVTKYKDQSVTAISIV